MLLRTIGFFFNGHKSPFGSCTRDAQDKMQTSRLLLSRVGNVVAAAGGPAPLRGALSMALFTRGGFGGLRGLAGGAKKGGGNELDVKGAGSELDAIFEAASRGELQDINRVKVVQLRAILRTLGMPTSGTRPVLLKRMMGLPDSELQEACAKAAAGGEGSATPPPAASEPTAASGQPAGGKPARLYVDGRARGRGRGRSAEVDSVAESGGPGTNT